MPVRRRSLRELWRNDTCVWSDSGKKKLPFAGYSDVVGRVFRPRRQRSLQIVWDDLRSSRADIWHAASEEPQATKIPPHGGSSFPVVIGEGSHPFPFRTRKLSPLPPMVLHAQVCGRVGHCRGLFPKGPMRKRRAFFILGSCLAGWRVRVRTQWHRRATDQNSGTADQRPRTTAPRTWRIMSP
jgi:hypothetical protein